MAKTQTPGRRVGNVVVHKEGEPGGMRKIRCPLSGQIAAPTIRADGQRVFRTPNGTEYTTKKF